MLKLEDAMTTIDKIEKIKNNWLRLILKIDQQQEIFGSLGNVTKTKELLSEERIMLIMVEGMMN